MNFPVMSGGLQPSLLGGGQARNQGSIEIPVIVLLAQPAPPVRVLPHTIK